MPFLYSILIVFFILFLLLCIKFKLVLVYAEEVRFEVRWLFIKYTVYPAKAKVKKTKEKEKKEKVKEEKTEEKKEKKPNILTKFYNNQGVPGLLDLLSELLAVLGRLSKRLLSALVFDKFDLAINVGGDDAAAVALRYGKVCSVLYPVLGQIFSLVKVKKSDIDVKANFTSEESEASFHIVLALFPIILLYAIIILLIELLFKVLLKLLQGSRVKTKERKAEEK
ncbi:MAG: DUF2953 domain-containing protein [Clostridiales bacterium]|nr:DUF2953 domain-containing protein [Clostridiales bacterium]